MKKITFSTRYGLEQAVIDLTKTMTRREDKKLNHPLVTSISEWGVDDKGKAHVTITYSTGLTEVVYPAYQIGEEVAVAQSNSNLREVLAKRDFKRTDALYDMFYRAMQMGEAHDGMPGWKNKMFVRADLMPHRIRITSIRIERLQDITEEDAMREGVFKYDKPPLHHEMDMFAPWPPYVKPYKWDSDNLIYRCNARAAFAALIDRISGRGTWQRNPWVYVYEFELIKS